MIELSHPTLGAVEMRARPFIVVSFQIGARSPRPLVRNRALQSGGFDDTRYTGARAITVQLRLNEDDPLCGTVTMQDLYDRVLPFMDPALRPVLSWSLPGSPGHRRQATVRGVDAPVLISSRKHAPLLLSFVAPDGEITSVGDPVCVTLDPAADVELGRTYPASVGDADGRVYPASVGDATGRTYPPSLAIGDRIVTNAGNTAANWVLTIFGPVTNPYVRFNGVEVAFTEHGGLDLPAGSSVVIDSREHTVYLDGDPAQPRYDRLNFTAWNWQDLLLKPGDNLVRFGGDPVGPGGQATICSAPGTWAG